VLDGTWKQACEMYSRNRETLMHCTQVHFSQGIGRKGGAIEAERSEFVVRKQPAEHCVCTLEAVVASLNVIEPDFQCENEKLMTPLRFMMGVQVSAGWWHVVARVQANIQLAVVCEHGAGARRCNVRVRAGSSGAGSCHGVGNMQHAAAARTNHQSQVCDFFLRILRMPDCRRCRAAINCCRWTAGSS
jgi:hypothetical protein